MITGVSSRCRISRQSSKPFIPGSITSTRTTSGRSLSASESAVLPSAAHVTSTPCSRRQAGVQRHERKEGRSLVTCDECAGKLQRVGGSERMDRQDPPRTALNLVHVEDDVPTPFELAERSLGQSESAVIELGTSP